MFIDTFSNGDVFAGCDWKRNASPCMAYQVAVAKVSNATTKLLCVFPLSFRIFFTFLPILCSLGCYLKNLILEKVGSATQDRDPITSSVLQTSPKKKSAQHGDTAYTFTSSNLTHFVARRQKHALFLCTLQVGAASSIW